MPRFVSASAFAVGLACGGGEPAPDAAPARDWEPAVALPVSVANNAVTSVELEGGCMVFSMLGIGADRDAAAITRAAYRWREGDDSWLALPAVPGDVGRVAAAAVGLRGEPWLLGGYSVSGLAETSFDAVERFDLRTGRWVAMAPMPVPVDDQVAVAWRDRWIIQVSGWSNTGNVDAVQVYDADTDSWAMATPFPGTPVFGHAGALVGDSLIVIDGADSMGSFDLVNQAWLGRLDPDRPTEIEWIDLGEHPGPARYRAGGGVGAPGQAWFHGGTDVPYNYDGLSYATGEPSPPLASTLVFDTGSESFSLLADDKPTPTMDHRGLASCGDRVYVVGGMTAGPAVTDAVWRY